MANIYTLQFFCCLLMINTSKAKIDHTRKNGLLHFRFDGVKNGCLDELELFLAARATYFSQSKYIKHVRLIVSMAYKPVDVVLL